MTKGEERIVSQVRGIPVELTIDWLTINFILSRPTEIPDPPSENLILDEILRPFTLHRPTQIPSRGIRQAYAPLVNSITTNFRSGTRRSEIDYGNLLLVYQIRHALPVDVPRMMIGFIIRACHNTHAFPFPGIITLAICQVSIDPKSFIPGTLCTKSLITATTYRHSLQHNYSRL